MSFGIPVRNGLSIGLASYATIAAGKVSNLWTPALIPTSLWLDAADSSTITLNGSTVSQWNDKSGNNNHASQSTAANQPTYQTTGFNNMPTLSFDGVSDGFNLVSALSVPRSIYVVDSGNGFLFSNEFERILWASSTTANTLYWDTQTGFIFSPALMPGRTNSTSQIDEFILTSTYYEYWNTGLFRINGTGTYPSNPLSRIGLKWTAFSSAPTWTGRISEIVVTSSMLSADNRQLVEGYLAWKWGLQGQLPAGHPYKNRPPLASDAPPPLNVLSHTLPQIGLTTP